MKKIILSAMIVLMSTISCMAQQVTTLPAPQKTGGKTIVETLWNRKSGTKFGEQMLSQQDLSNLLFATIGVNRENGKMTSPTARNLQEIRVFVFTAEGVSEYLNKEHSLKSMAQGDYRHLIAGRQDWVKTAPVILLFVADGKKFGNADAQSQIVMGIDAGIVCENVNMFCAGMGLVTRPRMSMDKTAIKQLLNLDDTQQPLMNNPVGYAK